MGLLTRRRHSLSLWKPPRDGFEASTRPDICIEKCDWNEAGDGDGRIASSGPPRRSAGNSSRNISLQTRGVLEASGQHPDLREKYLHRMGSDEERSRVLMTEIRKLRSKGELRPGLNVWTTPPGRPSFLPGAVCGKQLVHGRHDKKGEERPDGNAGHDDEAHVVTALRPRP